MKKIVHSCDPTETGAWTEKLAEYGPVGNVVGQLIERLGGIGSLVIIALVAYSAFTGTPIHGLDGVAGYGNEEGINAVVAALAAYFLRANGED